MHSKKQNTIWTIPWGFRESGLIVTGLMISGFLIDLFSLGKNDFDLSYPLNIIYLIAFFSVGIVAFLIFRKSHFVKWLRSAQLAIISISWILFLVLLMGIFNQQAEAEASIISLLRLNNIVNSSAFVFLQIVLIVNLSYALLNRVPKLNLKNLLFITNHLGIIFIILGLGLGSADISKYTFKIYKNEFSWKVKNNESEHELPFAIKLLDFKLENFPAKIGIIENATDRIIKGKKSILQAENDSAIVFNQFNISLKKYLKNAVQFGENFHSVNEIGSCPAAFLEVKNNNNLITKGWVSRGSYLYPSVVLSIDSNYTLAMLEPEAKSYKSTIKVFFKDGNNEEYILEVNKPIHINGWDIYQTDYDKEKGEWSDYSVIELVNDPWINIVYTGIFLMLSGALMLIFTGRKNNDELV